MGGGRRQVVAFPVTTWRRMAIHGMRCSGWSEAVLASGRVVPPAGFEPALTAPEAVAVYGPDQRKRALARLARARIGRNPRDRTPGTVNGGGAGEHRGASTGFRPAVLLHGMSRRRCRQV